ncbi:hypothetical protein GCM10007874_64000 [Labrys miyagiensis]|uniref:Uncharacterized protein n=1 Tax=Labrys miyagiensis TaxID=346912 RepID=A0ABQ6CWJ0_9HYPH|nr:hypothetical protein GCM10007874_64000 [Labrys miyagiensis]
MTIPAELAGVDTPSCLVADGGMVNSPTPLNGSAEADCISALRGGYFVPTNARFAAASSFSFSALTFG